jgi:hypothetical protein
MDIILDEMQWKVVLEEIFVRILEALEAKMAKNVAQADVTITPRRILRKRAPFVFRSGIERKLRISYG